jgi:hypothetical protein
MKLSDLREAESISTRIKFHRAMVAALRAMVADPPPTDAPKYVMLSFGMWGGRYDEKYDGSVWFDRTDPRFPSFAWLVIEYTEELIADELKQLQALGIAEEDDHG